MPSQIHPTAIVDPLAQLGADVVVGAYAFVGAGVRLGDGTVLHHHATVEGNTTLGRNNEIFPYACVGTKTQDLKFKGGRPGLRVGDGNVIREFCTVHTATHDGDFTIVGSNNCLLAYVHVAHDCVLGDRVIMSNNASLAGHVIVEDAVVMGGFALVHQFCRIGRLAMIGGAAKVRKDAPPFMIVDGDPAVVRSINKVGLERAGFTAEQVERVKSAYRVFYREGNNHSQAFEKLRALPDAATPELAAFIAAAENSERGLMPGAR
jgi:UDP-N-acetylglucosamine acyltransferase